MYKCPDCGLEFKRKGFHWIKHCSDEDVIKHFQEQCSKGGKALSREQRSEAGKKNKGKVRTLEQKENYRLSKLGSKNPQFGKPTSPKQKDAVSKANKHPKSEEMKKNLSKAIMGHPCYGIEGNRQKHIELYQREPERKTKHSEYMKELWKDPEYARETSIKQGRRPNKLELYVDSFLQENFPGEWKYVGDGKFWIEGKNPDYININGRKAVIELWGNYWHKGDNPQDRIDFFKQYGFECLIIWEADIEDSLEKVLNTIKNF